MGIRLPGLNNVLSIKFRNHINEWRLHEKIAEVYKGNERIAEDNLDTGVVNIKTLKSLCWKSSQEALLALWWSSNTLEMSKPCVGFAVLVHSFRQNFGEVTCDLYVIAKAWIMLATHDQDEWELNASNLPYA